MFGRPYEVEANFTPQEWQEWVAGSDKAMFGLFNNGVLVGITGIVTHRKDPTVGFMVASFLGAEYRGRGLSDMFYKARIDWAKSYLPWKKIVVGHRDGNEPSRRANQRHGFVFTHRETKTWPDGITCDELCYELDLEKLRKENV